MSAILETPKGTITYSDDFIATVAGVTATECYGVVGMVSKKMSDGIVMLLKRGNLSKGVKVYTDQSKNVRIELYIMVEFGISIPAAANSIIETVRYHVEKATGLTVSDVSVIVSSIRVQS